MRQKMQKPELSGTCEEQVETLGSIVSRWLEINDLGRQAQCETMPQTKPAEICEAKLLTV